MLARFSTIKLLVVTTALFVPHAAFSQEASAPVPPAKDAEYRANWGLEMINAMPAYRLGYTGKRVTVAIVDTGLDVDHPEFAGRVSGLLRNFGKDKPIGDVSHTVGKDGSIEGHGTHVAGIIGAARDGSGVHGVAYESTLQPYRAIGVDGRDPHEDTTNEAIEYAIRAGAGVLNGSYGFNPLLGPYLKDKDGNYKVDEQGASIENPYPHTLDYQPVYEDPRNLVETYNTLKKAAKADIVLVFAASNDAWDQPAGASAIPSDVPMLPLITPENTRKGQLYKFVDQDDKGFDNNNPATYKFLTSSDPFVKGLDFSDLAGSLIAVVAVDKDGKIASYSNRCGAAAEWCLAAPGGETMLNGEPPEIPENGIYSTWPVGDPTNKNKDRNYKYEDGTSAATPHVAGAAAVVRSAFPYMNARQTIETILTTAADIGLEEVFGQGLLNLGAAIGGPMEFRYPGVFDVNTHGYSSIWTNPISGPGNLTKRGEGALILRGDNSTYTGPTKVLGGTLAVDGSVVSHVSVSGAGTLAGVGAVGALTAGEGGAVAPGSVLDPARMVSLLSVDGNLVQKAGSTYRAGIASTSDLIDIAGSAAIDGGAQIELLRQGTASAGTRYTLLTAAGGVNGTYGGLTGAWATNTPFVDFSLAYDPHNVFLDTERTATAFAEVGRTFNQRSVAEASQGLGAGNTIHDNILFLTTSEARSAFDQLTGEVHASIHGALIQNSHFIRDAAGGRIRAAFEGVGASTFPVMAYGPDRPDLVPAIYGGLAVWGQGFGVWGHLDGVGNAAKLDHSTGGFIAGGDAPAGDHWRLGLLAGYSHTSFDVDDRASSGSSKNHHLGLYAGTQRGALGFRSGLVYSWHRIETNRSVVFPGVSDSPSADYDAGTFQAFGELGYRLDTASASFEPYANLAYVKLDVDGFTEDGGVAALSSEDHSSDTTFTTLGLRASTALTFATVQATVRGMIGWRHAFGDVTPETSLAFAGGPSFAVEGTPIAENAAIIEAGLDMNLTETATLGLAYQGQIASDAQEHSFNGKLSVRF